MQTFSNKSAVARVEVSANGVTYVDFSGLLTLECWLKVCMEVLVSTPNAKLFVVDYTKAVFAADALNSFSSGDTHSTTPVALVVNELNYPLIAEFAARMAADHGVMLDVFLPWETDRLGLFVSRMLAPRARRVFVKSSSTPLL